jgi:hypothetical protein
MGAGNSHGTAWSGVAHVSFAPHDTIDAPWININQDEHRARSRARESAKLDSIIAAATPPQPAPPPPRREHPVATKLSTASQRIRDARSDTPRDFAQAIAVGTQSYSDGASMHDADPPPVSLPSTRRENSVERSAAAATKPSTASQQIRDARSDAPPYSHWSRTVREQLKRNCSSGESSDEDKLVRNQQRRSARHNARERDRVAAIDARANVAHAQAEVQMRRILQRDSPSQDFTRLPQA